MLKLKLVLFSDLNIVFCGNFLISSFLLLFDVLCDVFECINSWFGWVDVGIDVNYFFK